MAYELNASNLLNPMMVWSDLGLRALDMTVSSTQNISESVDRLTRAGASVEPVQDVASRSTVSRQSDFAFPSGVALSADVQRSAFDMMLTGWLQWMSTLGTFASVAAGLASNRSLKRQDGLLGAMRKSLLPFSGADTAARQSHSSTASRQHSGRRDSHAESGSMEHAFAAGEHKRRRSTSRGKAKSRRSRNT